jgi:hypothetical protein
LSTVVSFEEEAPPTVAASAPPTPAQSGSRWICAARFVLVWLFVLALGLYLKWYMLVAQGGFAREARSMGLSSLGVIDHLSFFRSDLLLGAVAIPAVLLVVGRFLSVKLAALITGAVSALFLALIAIQLFALKEVGRFSSLKMFWAGLQWGLHEPGSGFQYLLTRETLAAALALCGGIVAMVWAVRTAAAGTPRSRSAWKVSGELYGFLVLALILCSLKSQMPSGPYHESSFARSLESLWREGAVETGEFSGLDRRAENNLALPDLSGLSASELIAKYQALAHVVPSAPDPRYFGKEQGANVLFFILETTPYRYLPIDGDLSQFPNLAALRERSFVGARHYTTFPITRAAVFSLFSSWYPLDDAHGVFDSPDWDRAADFLPRLASAGYQTAVFSPLKAEAVPDAPLFGAVGFAQQFYPPSGVSTYDQGSSWKEARVSADLDTLHMLESQIGQWSSRKEKFAAAFLPQIAHSPYPDSSTDNSAEGLEHRGRAILATEDAWLGEILALLKKNNELDNTVIVVLGDHGLRAITENPAMRRGTIEDTAFHVPLLIYAPRALDHSERIDSLTSHVDIVPTVLDLLGQQGGRESEQGTAIWSPAIAARTTYFFAKPMFGADGYTANGQFFMWHYFSDSVYEKSTPEFDSTDIIPRKSAVAGNVTSTILSMRALEMAWHRKFSPAAAR